MTKIERQKKVAEVRGVWEELSGFFDERTRRLWAAAEANRIGYGGGAIVAEATGISLRRIGAGKAELLDPPDPADIVRVRRRGGGRKKTEAMYPVLMVDLGSLVSSSTRGDPESHLLWTTKSLRCLAEELIVLRDVWVCPQVVARMLDGLGYSRQSASKFVEGAHHEDRDVQFEYIDAKTSDFIKRGLPVVSVDTKKKELVGNFKNNGRKWRFKGCPELTNIHDFPQDAEAKAIPYGVYDIGGNSGFVNVGIDHDTAAFAVASIKTWWLRHGAIRYPGAKELYITADAGGSNGCRVRLWKYELQRLANELGMVIHVSHFPPGTSKWNKIEHRLFSFISINWRGEPLRTLQTVVDLIGGTRTRTGLVVAAQLDESTYPLGEKVSDRQMASINITRDEFHGEWNYTISPTSQT